MIMEMFDRLIISYYYKRLTDVAIFAREKLKALDDRDRDKPEATDFCYQVGGGMENIRQFV